MTLNHAGQVKQGTTPETRERIKEELEEFATLSRILPILETAVGELMAFQAAECKEAELMNIDLNIDLRGCEDFVKLMACIGNDTVNYAYEKGDRIYGTTMIPYKELCQLIDNTVTEDDAQVLKTRVEILKDSFHHGAIAKTNEVFGALKRCMRHEYSDAVATIAK